jgi:hypothetical protein
MLKIPFCLSHMLPQIFDFPARIAHFPVRGSDTHGAVLETQVGGSGFLARGSREPLGEVAVDGLGTWNLVVDRSLDALVGGKGRHAVHIHCTNAGLRELYT